MRFLISPYPHRHSPCSALFPVAILLGVTWCLTVVLICASLVTNVVKLLLMCWSIVCVSSVEKCLFKCQYFNWIVFLLLIVNSLRSGARPLSDRWFACILFPFHGLSFYFLWDTKVPFWWSVSLFSFVVRAFAVLDKKPWNLYLSPSKTLII